MSDTTPSCKTVRVRILVAVDDKGNWTSAGYGEDNNPKSWIILDDLSEIIRYHWVEADVPLPNTETTIEGTVTPDASVRVVDDLGHRLA